MERADSRYEVDENGKVKMVVVASAGESPQKRFSDPSSALLPRDGLIGLMLNTDGVGFGGSDVTSPMMQRSTSPGSVVDPDEHFAADISVPSIAQPLTLHADVFTKISATAATATPSPATLPRTSGDNATEVASQFPSSPQQQVATSSGPSAPVTSIASAVASPNRRLSTNRISHLHAFLCTVPHLCTLSIDQITSLRVMVREYDALDSVIETGTNLQHVYVLASGTVEVFDMRQTHRPIGHKRIASITAPNIFGVESLIFDKPSEFTFASSTHDTTVLLVSKAQFLDLVVNSNIFAHSIGSRLTATMPQFTVFQDFCRAVFSMSSVVADEVSFAKCEGYTLHLPSILECYSRIGTVIHPLLHKAEIDVGALQYACARLPANIAETFVINLARSLPPFLSSELKHQQITGEIAPCLNCSFSHGLSAATGALNTTTDVVRNVTYVSTANRRRSSWRIGDKGHTLILMRDGLTDVIDFMTSFCIHVIEARKLRIRLQSMISPCAADVLKEAIVAIRENPVSLDEVEELQKHVLGQLPLTPTERAGLASMWPHSAVQKLYNVIMHQEQYIVKVDTSLSKRFAVDSYFHWALKIRGQVLRALGLCDQDTLPPTVEISIISSRNRSIKNLLCSLASTHADEIQAMYESSPDIQNTHFVNDSDRHYYTLFRMINENDNLRQHYGNVLKKCGFSSFEDHTSSGLQLDLIDVSRLDIALVDPYLAAFIEPHLQKGTANRRFLINVDFTFGAQAEGIMRSLFLTFGHSITSVNIVGKCAGIRGNRGDVLLPKKLIFSKAAFGEDTTDEIRDCGNASLSADEIQQLIGTQRQVLTGPCITIPGMILQNEPLIKFYRLIYQAAGMEMEGSYVARQVEECANLGIISRQILTRFVFYMSDMPLGNEDGTKFNARLKSSDTITTMYASIRATLKAILTSEGAK